MNKFFNFLKVSLISLLLAFFVNSASAFDANNHDASMLSESELKAMVDAAMKVSPPKNGKHYVFGFANLQRDIAFCALVEEGILANAKAAGIEVLVTDNLLDGATAMANADSYLTRNVDYVIEFQTDAAFGEMIMNKMNMAGVGVTAIDIPMPGAGFFGANNPKSGYIGGLHLATAAITKWGADVGKDAYLVIGALPQSGAVVAMRSGGQEAGARAVLPDISDDRVIVYDAKQTLELSFQEMNNVIGRIPEGSPILITAINDQTATGALRAVQGANRGGDAIVVGMGADELDTMMNEPEFIASVGYFPERYGNYLIPMALSNLANKPVDDVVLMNHVMISPSNICDYYSDRECRSDDVGANVSFPQSKFSAHLAEVRSDPAMQEVLNLIPSD
jgi:ribose transport system substrate-binding protein